MLFTRCPDCETTFRITAEALRKADGQVRCGRCACVFNGYNELRRPARRKSGSAPEESPARTAARARTNAREGRSTAGASPVVEPLSADATDAPSVEPAPAALPHEASSGEPAGNGDGPHEGTAAATHASMSDPSARARSALPAKAREGSAKGSEGPTKATDGETDAAVDDFSFAGVIAELEASAALDTDAPRASSSGVLVKTGLEPATGESPPTEDAAAGTAKRADALGTPSWVILDEARPHRFSPRVWMIACGAAAALLGLQVLHHNRGSLAVLGGVGPMIREAYALLGSEIAPEWNIEQYEIVIDWDAVAQPTADGEGNLKIAARIRNEGPRPLPLPHVQVQLKDRWESTLGSRVFAPAEYLPPGRSVDYVLKEGQSALAELDILDPGSQAYGFALDVCVDAANGALRCAEDEVFR